MACLASRSDQPRTQPLAALLAELAQARGERGPALPFGVAALDDRLADGGLDGAALHEIAAACPTLTDDAAATLFIAGIAARFASKPDFTAFWALTRFDLYAPGLEQVGLGPDKLLYAQGTSDSAVLAMAEDALRDGSLACVVAEVKSADQTATRRLQLAAGGEAQAIADLPLAALRLEPEALASAARFGLERIADLYPMPRAPLAKRLGLATVRRLDQARGLVAEPIVPIVPFEAPRVERQLLEPIGTAEAITQVIADLVDDLVVQLQERGLGLRAAHLICGLVDGSEQHMAIGTSRATREPKHLKRMLGMRVERIDPGLGIEAMSLTAPRVEALKAQTLEAGLGTSDRPPDIAPLIDQLAGRIEPDAPFRLSSQESDVPERAVRRVEALAKPLGWPAWKRPVRMLKRPELLSHVVALLPDHPPRRFTWRGTAYQVVAGDGPERIHGEWWRTPKELWAVRDYFRVEAEDGERFWLFRRGDGVDEQTGDLSWYMHGMFG